MIKPTGCVQSPTCFVVCMEWNQGVDTCMIHVADE